MDEPILLKVNHIDIHMATCTIESMPINHRAAIFNLMFLDVLVEKSTRMKIWVKSMSNELLANVESGL